MPGSEAPPGDSPPDSPRDPFAPPPDGDDAPLSLAPHPAPRQRPAVVLPPPAASSTVPRDQPRLPWLIAILLALPLCLLPPRWRKALGLDSRVPLATATVITGVAEAAFAGWLFAQGLSAAHEHWNKLTGEAIAHQIVFNQETNDPAPAQVAGAMEYGDFLLSWRGALLLLFFTEGLLRMVGGLATAEAFATLPLWLVDCGVDGARALRERVQLGPLAPDEVTRAPDGSHVDIASCRPRDWGEGVCLQIDGTPHHIVGRETRPSGRRRFRYRLEPVPAHWPLRKVIAYRADELPARRAEEWRTFWGQMTPAGVRRFFSRTRNRTPGR